MQKSRQNQRCHLLQRGHERPEFVVGQLGTQAVPRLRIGIGSPPGRMDGADFVLSKFAPDEPDDDALDDYESYNDYLAIFHGAYANSYTYTGGYVYRGIVRVKATSGNTSGVRFEKVSFDGGSGSEACVEIYPSLSNTHVLARCVADNIQMARAVMTGLVKRLRRADQKIESLALMDVYGRVAHALLEQASPDVQGQMVIRDKISRQDIAKMVGASREMVSRVMKDLEERGYIESQEGGSIVIKDRLSTLA